MTEKTMEQKNTIAQWAFDTRSVLKRFHLWLEDVETTWLRCDTDEAIPQISFVEPGLERALIMTAAVTALGAQLFGRYGDGIDADKKQINQVKKDADAITAYVMSESLWALSRALPENHAIMVSLGEGLMPKVGETPEMGSNPLLGFGRIYARPQVAKFLEKRVQKLINNDNYRWENFYSDIKNAGITIWGSAIDTLENTSRFAKGNSTGPMTILHLFDQPLSIEKPYEGYMGNLILPQKVAKKAEENSILLNFFTPRNEVLSMILKAYPNIMPQNVHVWTLRGKSREKRIGNLWKTWESLGVHLIDDEWSLPTGIKAFTDSGTYAPCFIVKNWKDADDNDHVLICDGYAASAEAMQAASLAPLLNINVSMALFTSRFELSYERESLIMRLDPEDNDFVNDLEAIFGSQLEPQKIEEYQNYITDAVEAGIPTTQKTLIADDFFPEKKWSVMALCGYICPDPYTGVPGVEKIDDDIYRVAVRLATRKGDKIIKITVRLVQDSKESRLTFSPLLTRFMNREDYCERPVKISDSGRIRNELQTLCSEALEHFGENGIRVYFERIPQDVILPEKQKIIREVLEWYQQHHPIWFQWLEIK